MGCCGGGSDSSGSDTKFKALSARWEIAPDPIGEGGFGSVHLATNRKTGKVSTAAATPCSRLVLCLRPRLGLRPSPTLTLALVALALACTRACASACALAASLGCALAAPWLGGAVAAPSSIGLAACVRSCSIRPLPTQVRALKAMRLKTADEREDFHNEISIMRKITKHHNICHLLDTVPP
jgi:serine/threonine protein kinase